MGDGVITGNFPEFTRKLCKVIWVLRVGKSGDYWEMR